MQHFLPTRLTVAFLFSAGWLLHGQPAAGGEESAGKGTAAAANSAAKTASARTQSGGTWLLRYKFRPNQFLHSQITHDSTITTRYGEFSQVMQSKSQTRKHFRVVSVDGEGGGLLETTIDYVDMSAKTDDGGEVSFNSERDRENCPANFRHILATVGRPLSRVRVAAAGRLVAEAGNRAGDESHISFLVQLPEQEVGEGDTWQDEFNVGVNVTEKLQKEVTIRRSYRLEGVEAGLATISLKTVILTPINDPTIEAQLIQRPLSGTIVFNLEEGVIESRELQVDHVVLNALGPQTSMRAVSKVVETRLKGGAIVANPAPAAASPDTPRKR